MVQRPETMKDLFNCKIKLELEVGTIKAYLERRAYLEPSRTSTMAFFCENS